MSRPEVLTLFQRQYGVAEFAQLVALGVSQKAIARARVRGAIVPVLPCVYTLAGTTLPFEGSCIAVVLRLGPHGYLSGTTAAALYGARSMPRTRIVATVPATARVNVPAWVDVRRSAWPDDDVRTRPDGLRLASPQRTLFDLAAEFNDHRFRRLAEDLWHLKLVSPDDASDYLQRVRRSGRSGVKRIEEWLDATSARSRPSQSGLELDIIDAIRAVGLPEPERQYPLRLLTGEIVHIDVAWPAVRFGVEPGHSWWHGGDLKQRADQLRDVACAEVGWDIKRFDESMRQDLMATARQIKNVYNARRARSGAS